MKEKSVSVVLLAGGKGKRMGVCVLSFISCLEQIDDLRVGKTIHLMMDVACSRHC